MPSGKNTEQNAQNPPLDTSILEQDATVAAEKETNAADQDEEREVELAAKWERIWTLQSERELRESQAKKVYRFAVGYCSTAAVFLFLSGAEMIPFTLSNTVLGVLAGSTAVAAISQIGFVTQGLFWIRKKKKRPKS